MESRKNFAARVLARTGMQLADIPAGKLEDLIGGHIMCRRGPVTVVGVGYPTQEPDGTEVYDQFVVVDQTDVEELNREIEQIDDPEDLLRLVDDCNRRGFTYLANTAMAKAMQKA